MARAREEYAAAAEGFSTDYTRQDAAVLNIQRACEAALDMGQHLVRREKLGLPQSSRDVFELLARAGAYAEMWALQQAAGGEGATGQPGHQRGQGRQLGAVLKNSATAGHGVAPL